MMRYGAVRTGVIALTMAAIGWTPACAETPVQGPSEYQVKAAFLYNFAKFVEWPEQSLSGREGVALCVFGQDPFGPALDQVTAGKTVNGRPLVIRRISDLKAAHSCHVLFVSRSEAHRVTEVTNAIASFGILSVTESDRLAEQPAVINFVMEGSRVRFQISAKAAGCAGLRISSKLFQLAVPAEQRATR